MIGFATLTGLMFDVIFCNSLFMQVVAYAFMGTSIIILAEMVQGESLVWRKTGMISFELYLIHIGLVPILLGDYSLTFSKVMIFMTVSFAFAFIVYEINRMINRGLKRLSNV